MMRISTSRRVGTTATALAAESAGGGGRAPVKVIYDTDFGGDVDDAGAAGLLNVLQDMGEVEVLAMVASNPTRHAAGGLDAINTYYGHPGIPIGTVRPVHDHVPSPPTPGAVIEGNNVTGYAELLDRGWPHDTREPSVPDAVDLYRSVLAEQKDRGVTIVTVGGQVNLGGLLASGPDRHSRLNGHDLVDQKVRDLVIMGAEFPSGREWNIMLEPGAAAAVARTWPTPVIYSGVEVGDTVIAGARLFDETHPNNPVRNAYEDCVGYGNGRSAWDLTAVYVAVRGLDGLFTYSEPGAVTIEADGSNTFTPDPDGHHRYLITAVPDEEIADALENLLVVPPRGGWH
jgi:inosine-uridine nucleoside N-ribohydrolase